MTADFRLHGNAAMRARTPRRRPKGKVITDQVNEVAYATALDLADGDKRRIHIISVTEILVVNLPNMPLGSPPRGTRA